MPDFVDLIDLAAERVGGAAIAANDEFFAAKENLLKPGKPVFREGSTRSRGKWKGGWRSVAPDPGHDWCVVRIGLPDPARLRGEHDCKESSGDGSIEACETTSLDTSHGRMSQMSLDRARATVALRATQENVFSAAAPRQP